MVSGEQERWKGLKGDIHSGDVGSVSWVGVVRVVPILSADMGYSRRGLQERERGVEDGAGLGNRRWWGL